MYIASLRLLNVPIMTARASLSLGPRTTQCHWGEYVGNTQSGSAGVRSGCAEGERYRQRGDDDPDRAEQAPQGPLRDAVAAAARPAARLVASFAARGAGCSRAAIHPSRSPCVAYPRLPHGCAGGRDREARVSAYAAAQLRHPSLGAERRCPRQSRALSAPWRDPQLACVRLWLRVNRAYALIIRQFGLTLYHDQRRLRGSEGSRGVTRSKYPIASGSVFPRSANMAP